MATFLLAYGQVVLVSEALSELGGLGLGGYVIGHFVLTSAAAAVWALAGRPNLLDSLPSMQWLTGSRILLAFASVVGVLVTANLIIPIFLPSLNWDAHTYHLPRAYFWLAEGTARHFPTHDFRQVEFPPNASFLFAWVMAFTGGYSLLHVPQWIGALVMSLGVAAMARLSGFQRQAAAFAGLVSITYPMTVMQMGSSQIDLITTATTAACVYFVFRCLCFPSRSWRTDAGYAGLALGLAIGTKLTVPFLIPGLAVTSLVSALIAARKNLMRRLAFVCLTGLLGVALFGAYNYVLNFVEIGDPIASAQGRAALLETHGEATRGVARNVVRYSYQVLDWPGFAFDKQDLLPQLQIRSGRAFSDLFGLGMEDVVGFHEIVNRARITEDTVGYGPIGFAVLIGAPCLLAGWLLRRRDLKKPQILLRFSLVIMGLSWLVIFAALSPWSMWKVRYFFIFMSLLSAVVLPVVWKKGRFAAVIVAVASTMTATHVTVSGGELPGGHRRLADLGEMEYFGPVFASEIRFLTANLPDGSVVGIHADVNSQIFALFRRLPQYSFHPIAVNEIGPALESGRVDAAIVGSLNLPEMFSNRVGMLPRAYTFLPDPPPFRIESRARYGLKLSGEDTVTSVSFSDIKREVRHLSLPTDLLDLFEGGMMLVFPLTQETLAGAPFTAACGEIDLAVRHFEDSIGIEIPTGCGRTGPIVSLVISSAGKDLLFRRAEPWGVALGPLSEMNDDDAWEEATRTAVPWADGKLVVDKPGIVGVTEEGMSSPEFGAKHGRFRWSCGRVTLKVPLPEGDRLAGFGLDLAGLHPPMTKVQVHVNGKEAGRHVLDTGPWSHHWEITGVTGTADIVITSDYFQPTHDKRRLSIAIKKMVLEKAPAD